jgi:TolB-like protein/tetratricopeptide (TPR) repeat protein
MVELRQHLATALAARYTIERELGHGGMSRVYLAQDLQHHRTVALKVFRPELSAALGVERFLREIAIVSRLHHPHILPLLDSDQAGGLLYYVMPYAGESLRERLVRERQLSLPDTIVISRQVADALQFAHSQDLVHRDVKPENILLTGDGAMVADFGIARAITVAGGERLTSTGIVVGTPAYMSPEQGAGEPHLDGRSDVFSLGCVVYEMLAGTPPFHGSTAQAIQARRMADPVPPLRTVRESIPEPVEAAIERALAKVAADRFATPTEFTNALATPAAAPRPTRRRFRLVAAVAALSVIALGVAGLVMAHRSPVPPSAAVIAIIPFVSSEPDSALARLGRDLVFTISADLDGVGEVRTVDPHTIFVQSADAAEAYSVEQATTLGRKLGAGSVLTGSLVRSGRNVRLDLELLGSVGATPLARVSVTDSPDSTSALTDSAAMRVLHQIWQRGEPPTPSLAALTTRSVPALRAFLEGERDMADGLWPDAEKAFARAMEADSAFWLAYWRHMYTRNFQGMAEDPVPYEALWLHRTELHGVDSLLLAADQGPGVGRLSVALSLGEEATRKYPENWWAWFYYADYLVHQGPRLGFGIRDGRSAFERTLVLNPRLAEGWAHLLMVTIGQDSGASSKAFGAYSRLSHDTDRVRWARLQYELNRNGDLDTVLADSMERSVDAPTMLGTLLPVRFLELGFPSAQIAYDHRVLRRGASLSAAPAFRLTLGRSWAARGAWDSALVSADAYAAKADRDSAVLEGYRLAVIGAWLGALDVHAARHRREAVTSVSGGFPPIARAEMFWLDGMLAVTLRDRVALAEARGALRQSEDSAWPVLDRSLAAFGLEQAGARRRAADSLAAIEWHRPDPPPALRRWQGLRSHPFLTGVNRIAAASWLAQEGDTVQAVRLLTWHETRSWVADVHAADAVLAGLAYLQLARIEEARGHADLASHYYQQFLRRYDRPVPSQRHLVEDAERALARLPQ